MNTQMFLGFIQGVPSHAAVVVYIVTLTSAWFAQAMWINGKTKRHIRNHQPSDADAYLYRIHAEPNNSLLLHAVAWAAIAAFFAIRFSGSIPLA